MQKLRHVFSITCIRKKFKTLSGRTCTTYLCLLCTFGRALSSACAATNI